jgi:hypothetical protein
MMLKLRFLASALIFVSLLTSCSSDPYANAGKCESPGESKVVDERVAVCTGVAGKSKWYFEGKYFDDAFLLAKIDYLSFSLTNELALKLKKENLYESFFEVYDAYKITADDLAAYANGDSRWDDLIELKVKLDRETETEKYLSGEATRLFLDWKYKGKGNSSEVYSARDASNRQFNLTNDLNQSFKDKLAPLRGAISTEYSLSDRELSYIFLSRLVKINAK